VSYRIYFEVMRILTESCRNYITYSYRHSQLVLILYLLIFIIMFSKTRVWEKKCRNLLTSGLGITTNTNTLMVMDFVFYSL